MNWWVYKCRAKAREYQRAMGDWEEVFDQKDATEWGSTEYIPGITELRLGDRILAYQTDRNELVGILDVAALKRRREFIDLYLQPRQRVGVKVRPLRKALASVRRIPAFSPGPVQSLYEISENDALVLLRAAGVQVRQSSNSELEKQKAQDERFFVEGEERAAKGIVRDPRLRIAAKQKWGLACFCCGFDFEAFYGDMGRGVAVVHHLKPFEKGGRIQKSTVNDVRIVCANCHLIIHAKKTPLGVDELRNRLSSRLH